MVQNSNPGIPFGGVGFDAGYRCCRARVQCPGPIGGDGPSESLLAGRIRRVPLTHFRLNRFRLTWFCRQSKESVVF